MGIFDEIFNSFSRRTPDAPKKASEEIPHTTKTRVLRWCGELYRGERSGFGGMGRDYNMEFWQEVYRRCQYRTGKVNLTPTDNGNDPREAANYILLHASTSEFLDFLEDIFHNDTFYRVSGGDRVIVDELNTILRQDKLPYTMTYFVIEEERHPTGRGTTVHVRSYPKAILRESEVLDKQAIAPALELLSQPHFTSASKEFLTALEEYRKGDFGDCLVKAGSAFESVMKVICDRKQWAYNQTDTAGPLIKIMIANTSLENYFEPLLIGVGTIRNKLSTAHGAGTTTKQPSRHVAQYVLNLTASAILMLTQETGI